MLELTANTDAPDASVDALKEAGYSTAPIPAELGDVAPGREHALH